MKPLFRGHTIQRKLIVRGFDDMHRISKSLKDGTVTAVLLVANKKRQGQLRSLQTAEALF